MREVAQVALKHPWQTVTLAGVVAFFVGFPKLNDGVQQVAKTLAASTIAEAANQKATENEKKIDRLATGLEAWAASVQQTQAWHGQMLQQQMAIQQHSSPPATSMPGQTRGDSGPLRSPPRRWCCDTHPNDCWHTQSWYGCD